MNILPSPTPPQIPHLPLTLSFNCTACIDNNNQATIACVSYRYLRKGYAVDLPYILYEKHNPLARGTIENSFKNENQICKIPTSRFGYLLHLSSDQ